MTIGLKILKEVALVGKPGGSFCFSSHNLNWCANLFELRRMISLDPKLVSAHGEAAGFALLL